MTAILVQIDGHDPVAGAAVTLRAASVDDDRVCHLDGQVWWPALMTLPALRYDLFDGAFGNAITTPQSSLALAMEAWPDLGRYMLADARVQIWSGEIGDAWAGYVQRFDGRVTSQPAMANGLATVAFAVDDRWLDSPLLATYAGTTGAEGEAALKGQPKPLAIGAPRFVSGLMVDAINNVVQLSSYGAIEGVEVAFERLAAFGAPVADYPSYTALVAATIPAGAWATAKAVGMVRHGAPPAGRLSYHLKGDKGGPDGWIRQPGSIIRRLALLSGGNGKTDDASLDALNAARPHSLSVYQAEQSNARELVQRIAASVNAVAGVSWLGKLWAVPIGFGGAAMTLDADGRALPPVASVEQLENGAPWWRLAIGAERTWNVHPLSDVAFTAPLIERGLYSVTESYREGHIVDTDVGARFLFIATTPATGSALPAPTFPPAPPAQNAHWIQLRPPATYADGRPIEELKPAAPGATPGAPAGSDIGGVLDPQTGLVTGGKPAELVLEDADNALVEQIVAAADAILSRERDRRLLFPGGDGADVRTAFRREASARRAIAAQLVTVAAALGGVSTSVQQLMEAFTDGEEGFARFLLRAQVDSEGDPTSIVGIEGLAGAGAGVLDFIATAIRMKHPVSGEALIYFDTAAGKMIARSVEVDTLKVNTAVVPVRATATNNITGTGVGGSWQSALSASIVMAKAGVIEADFITRQGFSSGDQAWEFELLVNGVVVYATGGGRTQDSIPLDGSATVAAGTHTALVRWRAHSSVSLGNRQLRLKGYPATE